MTNKISGFKIDPNARPMEIPIETTPVETTTTDIQEKTDDSYEPMFGVGMFDEPIPDTTGIIARNESTNINSMEKPIPRLGVSSSFFSSTSSGLTYPFKVIELICTS